MKTAITKKLVFLLLIACSAKAQDGKFTFTLSSPATTSAGVFKNDSILIRTLWNNIYYGAGVHTNYWDGKDDLGNVITAPAATYKIKVLSNNVKYTWQGTLGNTSDSITGFSKHRGYYHCMKGMAFGPTYGYFCTGYSEASPSVGKFLIAKPNSKLNLPSSGTGTTANTDYVVTDGINVYWAGFDAYAITNTFVYATKVSDDLEANLTAGTPYTVTYGATYSKAISKLNLANSFITGLAVQKAGTYLFVARADLNQVQVLNKTTGALVQTLTYTTPRGLSVDASGNLWMATGTNTVMRYAVNTNGTLTAGVLPLPGLVNPLATQVSTDGSDVTVADGGTSQQLKFFSTTNGAATSTIGLAGGYVASANVSNNKFYFSDLNGTVQYKKIAFIAYQADGSFWVNDPGNFRVQHYNSSKTYLDRIMSLGASYSVYPDKNNIKKVFSDFLEFEMDYSVQNLTGTAGWVLKNNWGATTSDITYNKTPKHITTLSNGRTYGLLRKGLNSIEVVEFPATGGLRFTGVILTGVIKILCSDGSLQDYTLTGTTAHFKRFPLTGFDGTGNPIWSTTPEILAIGTADNTIGSPINTPNSQIFSSTGKVVFFNHKQLASNSPAIVSSGYHLGMATRGSTNTFLFQTERSTHVRYKGPYPAAGFFDVGNKVNDFAGGNVNIIDRNVITSYHGEFWKDGQTNKFNHYYDNGLAISQFGITRPEVGMGSRAAAMMAGNALTPTMVKDANGDLYMYHGDESDHSGVHRWKITGLNTISEQVVSVAYPSTYVPANAGYTDLMAGLPFDAVLATNTAGWTRYPLLNEEVNPYVSLWRANTSKQSYQKLTSNDITLEFLSPVASTNSVSRDLGSNNVTSSWKITGEVIYPSGNNVNWIVAKQFIEVLDANNKVLTSFYVAAAIDGSTTVYGNSVPIATSMGNTIQRTIDNLLFFQMAMDNGKITFTYGNYPPVTTTIADATGNWKTPKTLRITMLNNGLAGPAYKQTVAIKDFKFYKDYSSVNQLPIAKAGNDQVLTLPVTSTTLTGSGIDPDGTIIGYNWVKVAGPGIAIILDPGTPATAVNILLPGIYKFELTVTDNSGAISKDTVRITLNPAPNKPPVVDAGGDQLITLPSNNTTLTGIVTDSDGTISNLTWTKVSGPAGSLMSAPNSSATVISNLAQGIYQYCLSAKDDDGAVTTDTVVITVNAAINQAPVANAGLDETITLPLNTITLSGSGADMDGLINQYSWKLVAGPGAPVVVSPDAASTSVINLLAGNYSFELTVTDDDGAIATDTMMVTVSAAPNQAPVAAAGTDITIVTPLNNVTLNGSGSDPDGVITTYAWLQLSGPIGANLVSPAAAVTDVNNLSVGIYEYVLTVTDDSGFIGTDTVTITVNTIPNMAPVADAGTSQVITLPANSTILTGNGIDTDGTIAVYKWNQVGGPAAGMILSPDAASTAIENLVEGTYEFELTVTDDRGAISMDSVQVIVNAAINQAPTADAGIDQSITLPINNTTLSGTGIDPDGTISIFKWKQISGPSVGILSSADSAITSVTDLVQGVYEFELAVTDDDSTTTLDIIQVTVNAALNQAPLADAGTDQMINLPVNTTNLTGGGTDTDGTIINYGWAQLTGPATSTIFSPNSGVTSIGNLVQGVYTYELTVTDNDGAVSKDTIQVTVSALPNQAPTADAGPDQSIVLPLSSVTLNGSGADTDGIVAAYSWTKISGPIPGSIASANAATTAINDLTAGVYEYELSVTDDAGDTSTDTILVTVFAAPNQLPIADAGSNILLTLPVNSTDLAGTGTDADGAVTGYSWTQISGPGAAILAAPALATVTASGLVQGLYEFELTVTDDDGGFSKDTIQVTVNDALNQAPVAIAGSSITITLPVNSTTLAGSGTDTDGTIVSYAWVKISGPAAGSIAAAGAAVTTVDSLVAGIYKFELTVTDDDGAISKDIVQVTVNAAPNQAPAANAGIDQVLTLPVNATTLTGSGTDTDGTIVNYSWKKISGPAGTLTTPGAATTIISNLVEGVYKYQLTVRDNSGALSSDTVEITVNAAPNQAPVANAGTDKTITLPVNSTTLSGTGMDADGTIVNYGWTKLAGPAAGTIASPNSGTTALSSLEEGVYEYELTVTDDDGAVSKDTVQVIVNAAPNQAPVADAGYDQSIILPVNNSSLLGSGTDPDGSIVSYSWTKLSGPAGGSITAPTSATSAISNLTAGVYEYELSVTDDAGDTSTDTILVTVFAAPNQLPIADAGSNILLTLPVNSTDLVGTGTDADGAVTGYSWTQISGPGAAILAAPALATATASGLVQGLYEFELTVTDDDGGFSKDTIQVTVNDALNQAPVAIAGSSITITLPVNSTTLAGSGTDTDGTIVSYAWVKISGPAAGSIAAAGAAVTTVDSLVAGIYKFELTVTDDDGAISKDIVQVTVNAAPNQAPAANAGIDQVLTLPVNATTLTGSGTDTDGTIVNYSWKKISGPAGTLTTPGAATTIISNLVEGVYKYQLTVRDNSGALSSDTVEITVNAAPNQAPVANAGTDKTITLPVNSTTLSGTGMDADGTIVNYGWTKLAGPAAGTIASPNSGTTALSSLEEGVYEYELTVTDDDGAVSKDTVQVIVNAAPNQAPVADAGYDQSIILPVNNSSLLGSGTDPDGSIVSYSWTKLSGPAGGSITAPTSATTAINNLSTGVYEYELTVTDNKGAVSVDIVEINVFNGPNQAPVASAGTDVIITLPGNSVTLTGSGTDTDGVVASYTWKKVSGPAAGIVVSAGSSATLVSGLIQGIYQFELTITDDDGAIGRDIVEVIVNPAPNKVPLANAGVDQSITLPVNTTTLSGSGTDTDGTITNFKWIKIAGPVTGIIGAPNSALTTISGLTEGIYFYQLTVTDNNGAVSKDTIRVIVNPAPNQAPLANAGSDKVITLPVNSTTLSGIGTDADGTIASYAWARISGPSAGNIVTANSGTTAVNNLVLGVYQFELAVVDDDGAISKDLVQVTVNPAPNQAPVANAGADKIITLPVNTANLTGSGIDPDGTIVQYAWTKISGPAAGTIAAAGSATSAVNNLVEGVYRYQLIVTDNSGALSKDTVQVTVNPLPNQAPQLNAGVDKIITLPVNTTTLTGTGSDIDGTIVTYAWTRISGPSTGTIATPGAATTNINNLVQGIYQYQLTGTDDDGAISRDTIKVTVNAAPNKAPVANAGPDKVITLPTNSATLNGSGTDPDGTIAGYSWTKLSGPAPGSIALINSGITAVNNLAMGIYLYQLTVTDNSGSISKDTVKVTVNPAPNVAPVVNAGTDISITLPTSATSLSGIATDADGSIASYVWTKISGPAAGLIVSPTTASTIINGLAQGTYQYEFAVKDNNGAISKDTVRVTVNQAPNLPPKAAAGLDKAINLPINSTTLNGSGSDPDGVIVSYAWKQLTGPSAGTISSPTTATTAVNALVQGVYHYVLTVTDNRGTSASDTVKVTVNAPVNKAPKANAGTDQVLTLPIDNTTLTGAGTDVDGTIAAYQWVKITGPAAGNIVSAGTAATAISSLVLGVYQFQLTVTDNAGATSADTVKITVNAPLNLLPVSNAGTDKTLTLPVNTTTLTGTGTDADGTIATYSWVKVTGPAAGIIVSPGSGTTVLKDLVEGVYIYKLTVIDNSGAIGRDTVKVTVNPFPNLKPLANAGSDIDIVLPVNLTSLSGSGTDPDGTIASYKWTVISGPANSNIVNATAAKTDIDNLFQGVYEVELTVTDNRGAVAKDTMRITVSSPRLINYDDEVKIYPVPVIDIANLNITSADPNAKVSILVLNSIGMVVKRNELVMTSNTSIQKLDLSNLSDAYYFVTVRLGQGKTKTFKILKSGSK